VTDGAQPLRGCRILVVEDDYLLTLVLTDFLEEAGAEVIGPIGWVEEALAFIEHDVHEFNAAVLDVNLHGSKSYPIADALAARSIKFIFATGYGADALDEGYRHYARCEKPVDQAALIKVFGGLLSKSPPS
jgi:DNA-binding NtrC family response regulator